MPSTENTLVSAPENDDKLWHNLPLDDVLNDLNTTVIGLSTDEVSKRIEKYGYNKLKGKKPRHPILKLIDQFRDPMVYLLMLAGIIALIAAPHDLGTPIFIAIALSLNAVFSYIQEKKAEEAMESLKVSQQSLLPPPLARNRQ